MTNLATYENLFNILAKTPGHIYWKDIHGIYQGSNDAQARFLGYKTGRDLIGKTDFDLPWRSQSEYFQQIDKHVIETQKEYTIEEVASSRDGVKLIFLSRKIPLYDPNTKKVIGVIGISLDITAAKQAEIAKQQFIMNMAHDLRTPLSGIIGIADIQAEQGTSYQDQQYGRWILEAGKQLLELLNAVLKVISTEQIDPPLEIEAINLAPLVTELKDLVRPIIRAKKLRLECICDTCLPAIQSDRLQLKRILLNLLSNAIKFTPTGIIKLEVKLKAIKNKRAKLTIKVSDTGIGIPKEDLDKIFDRFYQSQLSCHSEHKGYGIGLFLVKKSLERLGGQITVLSQEGKGSCFILTFNFPVAE